MNAAKFKHKYLLLGIMLTMLIAAALPVASQAASPAAQSDLIRLTVDNRDARLVTIRLMAPDAFYYLRAPGKTKTTFTVERDQYSYTLYGCGLITTGTFDLTKNMLLVNPICGGNARSPVKNDQRIDLSTKLKLVRVHIINETDQKTTVILTGPSTHVFIFNPDGKGTYTIAKDTYQVRFLACGVWNTREFTPYKDAKLVLRCAK